MSGLELIIALFVAAVVLAAAARRVGAPYPIFLALGGVVIALLPGTPTLTVPPDLALALFVAPVLLDAAYDASTRDLKDNWAPVTGLVVFAVGLTTVAVAVVTRALIPKYLGRLRLHWVQWLPLPMLSRRPQYCAKCNHRIESLQFSKARAFSTMRPPC